MPLVLAEREPRPKRQDPRGTTRESTLQSPRPRLNAPSSDVHTGMRCLRCYTVIQARDSPRSSRFLTHRLLYTMASTAAGSHRHAWRNERNDGPAQAACGRACAAPVVQCAVCSVHHGPRSTSTIVSLSSTHARPCSRQKGARQMSTLPCRLQLPNALEPYQMVAGSLSESLSLLCVGRPDRVEGVSPASPVSPPPQEHTEQTRVYKRRRIHIHVDLPRKRPLEPPGRGRHRLSRPTPGMDGRRSSSSFGRNRKASYIYPVNQYFPSLVETVRLAALANLPTHSPLHHVVSPGRTDVDDIKQVVHCFRVLKQNMCGIPDMITLLASCVHLSVDSSRHTAQVHSGR